MTAADPASKRHGPRVTVELSCFDCAFERSGSYRCQSDSGHEVYCDHPSEPGRRIGDTNWDTPTWCPLKPADPDARARAAETLLLDVLDADSGDIPMESRSALTDRIRAHLEKLP